MLKTKTEIKQIKLPYMDPAVVDREIGDFIIREIVTIGKNGGVLGLSGGVDSTVTGAVTDTAFERYNSLTPQERFDRYNAIAPETDLELVGYMLPTKLNEEEETLEGERVAKKLGIRYEVIDLEPFINSFATVNPDDFLPGNEYHKGNSISEIRGLVLRRKAGVENKLLLGTGNSDEDFGVAYYTLFGDGAVHLSPIGNLSKRLVKQMAEYKKFASSAKREPKAGLEPGQTDFKNLGYEYEAIVEPLREGLSQGFTLEELTKHPQIVASAEKQIKLYEEKFGNKKFHNVEEMVYDFFRRNQIAKAKTSILHPPVAPVTLYYNLIYGYQKNNAPPTLKSVGL